jgi:glycosyltransferase involved in cell wall biosynthesis
LARALERCLGPESFVTVSCPGTRPREGGRTWTDRLGTLHRDLWWTHHGVSRAALRLGADLLHMPATVAPMSPRLPTVVTIHDVAVLRFPHLFRPWFRRYGRMVIPRAARAARRIITVSEASKQDICDFLGIAPQRVTVIPNGVEVCTLFRGSVEEVRSRYALPGAFALAVGSIEPRKNLARLLRAVAWLQGRPETRDLVLVHAGPPGWLLDDLFDALRRLRPAPAVRFLGYVPEEELGALYRGARLMVYPSLFEGFGLPVLEAMACGCPVVTSNSGALAEVAGDAAVLVDPTSEEAIADGIRLLWTDAELRERLAFRGSQRAAAFTWEGAARATSAVYREALS